MMKYFASGYGLAKEMGIPAATLEKTLKVYFVQAKVRKGPFGKKFFQDADFRMDDYFNVAIMTPVLHSPWAVSRSTRSRAYSLPETSPFSDCSPLVRSRVVSTVLTVSVVRLYSNVLPVIVRLRIACSRAQV